MVAHGNNLDHMCVGAGMTHNTDTWIRVLITRLTHLVQPMLRLAIVDMTRRCDR